MPRVEENRSFWGETYNWPQAGEEWSTGWGGARMQWYGSILPRVNAFVPADTILEIGPGYRRWTAFLKDCATGLSSWTWRRGASMDAGNGSRIVPLSRTS